MLRKPNRAAAPSLSLSWRMHVGHRSAAIYTRFQCPYILADGTEYQLQLYKRFIVSLPVHAEGVGVLPEIASSASYPVAINFS